MDAASAFFQGKVLAPEIDRFDAEQVVQLQYLILKVLGCSPRLAELVVEAIPIDHFLSGMWHVFFTTDRFDAYCLGLRLHHEEERRLGLAGPEALQAVLSVLELTQRWSRGESLEDSRLGVLADLRKGYFWIDG